MKSKFIDDYVEYDTTSLLCSKTPTELEKGRIVLVLSYLVNHYKSSPFSNTEFHKLTSKILDNVKLTTVLNQIHRTETKNKDVETIKLSKYYDELKFKIDGCNTNECLLLHAATTYGLTPKSLLMDTIAIHSRVKKLNDKDEWFDNFTLNSYLLQLSTIVYSEYDELTNDEFIKSITFKPGSMNLTGGTIKSKPISANQLIHSMLVKHKTKTLTGGLNSTDLNQIGTTRINEPNQSSIVKSNSQTNVRHNIKLTNPKELLYHLGNEYRTFIEFGLTKNDYQTLDDTKITEMLDKLVDKYPYFTGLTHGCDVFTSNYRDKSVSINDIKEFCSRYPTSIVGYILNTETYASGRGQHWVSLIFKNQSCYLICSQGSSFSCFKEPTLYKEIKSNFAVDYNTKTIQVDSSSCGLYSVLVNLVSILLSGGTRDFDIRAIVDKIGLNAKNINSDGIYAIKKKICGYD